MVVIGSLSTASGSLKATSVPPASRQANSLIQMEFPHFQRSEGKERLPDHGASSSADARF
jgi:hypothetical protein